MAGKHVAKREQKRGAGKFVLAALLALVLGGYLGVCAWVDGQDMALPNVTLAGQDVSGMSESDAVAVAQQALADHAADAVITLTCGDDWSGQICAADLIPFDGYAQSAALEAVMAPDGNNFFGKGLRYIRHMLGMGTEVGLSLDYQSREQPAMTELFDAAQQTLGSDSTRIRYEVSGEELVVTKGKTDVSIDRNATAVLVFDAMEREVFPALFRGETADVSVEMVVGKVAPENPDYGAIHTQLYTQAVEPTYDKATGTVTDHAVGIDFDVKALQNAYEAAAEGETFSLPLTVTQPKDTKAQFEAKLFADVLGEGLSRVGGTANRKTNVKLSAAACDGVILLPGEEFSYNNTTGSRSADKGYLPAPTYNNGASVDDVGGGICQTSSTIYYAVLHTALEIVERHNHSYATGYVPDGMDATVFFGSLDFRFKNSTNYPIQIDTQSYDSNGYRYLKVRIIGTNEDGRYAVPERTQFDYVEPGKSYLADETVPQGTLVLDSKQNAYTGRKAQVYRYVYEADGTLAEKQDMGVSRYKMRNHLYRYNPLDGDPATWPNGVPPQPAPVEPVPAPTPETPAETPAQTPAETPAEVPAETAPGTTGA